MDLLIIRPGDEFTHDHKLDLSWKPGPGQKYADAPKARMQVTRVTNNTIWFTYAGQTGPGWCLQRSTFAGAFGAQIRLLREAEKSR